MEKPIQTIMPTWSKSPLFSVRNATKQTLPWLLWGTLPSIVALGGVLAWHHFQVASPSQERPIELMSEVTVVSIPMSPEDAKASEIRYLPMPRWQLETLPQPTRPVYNERASELASTPPQKPQEVTIKKSDAEPQPETVTTDADPWDLKQLDFSGMSDDLVAQLKMAIADTQKGSVDESTLAQEMMAEAKVDPEAKNADGDVPVVSLYALPEDVKHSLPKINLQTHLYASSAEKRSVRVNGLDVGEGEIMAEGVMLERIEPRQIVFWFDGHRIAMPALSEW